MIGSTLYLVGKESDSGDIVEAVPCEMCKRLILNAGIETVVARTVNGGVLTTLVSDWVSSG